MPAIDEVVVVDGGSTDGTRETAVSLWPKARVIEQTGNGKGNALSCGFGASTGDIIVTLDADGSADPREIPVFVAALRAGADFVKGTRFARGGGSSDITPFRRAGNTALTWCVNSLFKTEYTDLCYGYNAFWAYCLPHIRPNCSGFEIETLMNIRVAQAGLAVREVGSFETPRIHGQSNLHPVRDGTRILRTILREWAHTRTNGHRLPVSNRTHTDEVEVVTTQASGE